MPFKIIQTIEKGRFILTTVPHEWEKDGTLYWPKTEIHKLQRIENSRPEANWEKLNCILKRSQIPSYTKAESEIDKMTNFSDTETDNDNYRNTSNYEYIKSPKKSHKILPQRNYNEMAKDLMESQAQPIKDNIIPNTESRYSPVLKKPVNLQSEEVINDVPTSIQRHTMTENLIDTVENYDVISEEILTGTGNRNLMSNLMVGSNTESLSTQNTAVAVSNIIGVDEALTLILQKVAGIQEDLKTLASDVKIINNNQQIIFQNQSYTLSKVTELQIQLDEIVKKSSMPKTPDAKTVTFKPISNQDELQELESSLRDPDFKSRLTTNMEIVCSKGKNRGMTNAYALIDVLFDRKFLVDCSWGGGSKSEQSKIGLRSYKNIFDLFFSVLYQSDPDFKKPDCEKFFKTILKNARQRCSSKQTRLSTTRLRVKADKKTDSSAVSVSDQCTATGDDDKELTQAETIAGTLMSSLN